MVLKGHKLPLDYDEDEKQDWMHYLEQNIKHHSQDVIPYPESGWSYHLKNSTFNQEDSLKKSDESLKEAVVQSLYSYPDIDASGIIVDVLNGHVSLTGEVSNLNAKKAASIIVNGVDGVWELINDLIVKSD